MQNSLSHVSSARKKLLQYQQTVKKQESQSGYMGRTLSREHSKMMESILREGLEKEESDRVLKHQYSTRGYHSNVSSMNKTPSSSGKKLLDIELSSLNTTNFKPLKTSKSNKFDQIRIESNNEETSSQADHINAHQVSTIPQFYNDTDEIRSARQNELMQAKKKRFEFSFIGYVFEVMIGYGLFIAILYLIRAGSFPYFEVLLVIALTLTINPWKISNLLLPFTAIPITIANHYLGLSSLTYISILICYLGTMTFNQRYKTKILFIIVIITEVIVGLFFLPAIFKILPAQQYIYYYLFPLFMFILRNFVQLLYWMLGYSEGLFLQIPLFIIGLEYGTVLSISVGEIQFWYLIVFFTLQIMNDRTHFCLRVMVNLAKFCYPQLASTPTSSSPKNNHLLPAHWNGFSSLHSFHLIICIYIFTSLPLSSSPYTQSFSLSSYIQNSQWYKPLIVWCLVSVYEVMCLMLGKKRQDVMLVGYTRNRWYHVMGRGVMLVLGLWMFYIGLGVGALAAQKGFT